MRSAPPFPETLDRLLQVVVLMEADMQSELAARGLTKSRTHVLWELAARGTVNQRELADAVGVAPRTMTGLVDGLESSGFVVRRPDPADRRASHVELTPKGREAADWLVSSHEELATTLFSGMSASRYAGFASAVVEVRDRLQEAIAAAEGADR